MKNVLYFFKPTTNLLIIYFLSWFLSLNIVLLVCAIKIKIVGPQQDQTEHYTKNFIRTRLWHCSQDDISVHKNQILTNSD